jgi:divalent metal cation (Fe/Co/Zn/Cd) transporter
MDTIPGQTLNQQIIALLRDLPDIKHIDEIQTHRFGPYIVINITICVDGSLSVMEGDSIATQVERTLTENIEFVTRVHVHYHPASV